MATIWDEEEKKRRQMIGAPLATVSVESPTAVNPNIQEQKGPPGIGQVAQNIVVNRALNQGLNKAEEGIGKGIDKAKEIYNANQAPLASAPVAPTEIAGAAPADQAALNLAENIPIGDVTSGMVDVTAAPLADAATNVAADVATNVATDAATNAATNVATNVASDAASTATINLGTSATATEWINGYDVKTAATATGYNPVGSKIAGTVIATQLTVDTPLYAKYAETGTASSTGGDWYIKIEYLIPGPGERLA